MQVFKMEPVNIPIIADLMRTIKPDWWDYEGALGQLSDINESIKTVGWYLGDDAAHPKGWILCREFVGYRAIELECGGFDDYGIFKLEHKLGQLFDVATKYALEKGYLTFRSGISSIGFNIHGEKLIVFQMQSGRFLVIALTTNGIWKMGFVLSAFNLMHTKKGFILLCSGKNY